MLEDGRLVVLDTRKRGPTSTRGYWLTQAEPAPRPAVQEVIRWIRAEARKTAG
jgi:DNA-binding transcriptional LysR family regulator